MADEPNDTKTADIVDSVRKLLDQVIERFALEVEADASVEAVLNALLESKGETEETLTASMRRVFQIDDYMPADDVVAMAERFGLLIAESEGLAGFAERLRSFETKDRERSLDDAIDRWALRTNPPKININHKVRVEGLRAMAERSLDDTGNLDRFHAFMEHEPAVLPMSGATEAPDSESDDRDRDRDRVARRALSAYKADPSIQRMTSAQAFVNLAFREAGQDRLSETDGIAHLVAAAEPRAERV